MNVRVSMSKHLQIFLMISYEIPFIFRVEYYTARSWDVKGLCHFDGGDNETAEEKDSVVQSCTHDQIKYRLIWG